MSNKRQRIGLAISLAWAVAPGCGVGADLMGLGDLPGGGSQSYGTGVSADGSIVVGVSESTNGQEAFIWTASGGLASLGDLPGGGFGSSASGVGGNGSVVVGDSLGASGYEAFYWTPSDGMERLADVIAADGVDTTGWVFQSAAAVSDDGQVVVGIGGSSPGGNEAYRWTRGDGLVGLGGLTPGVPASNAYATNTDGSVVVGASGTVFGLQAFRWTLSDGMEGLGRLPGTPSYGESEALGVNADGSVVVGWSDGGNGREAFRWTQAGGMVGLGDLPGGLGFYGVAFDVNVDGSVVVGFSKTDSGLEAFRWTEFAGMLRLSDVLTAAGVDTTGWVLKEARGVSDDGSVIVGFGESPSGTEAFRADLSVGALIGMGDFFNSAADVGTAQMLATHAGRAIGQWTLPHVSGVDGRSASPVIGYVRGSQGVVGGVAFGWERDGVALTAALGALDASDDVRYGGETSINGAWGVLGASVRPKQWAGIELSAAIQAGRYAATIERRYLNGAGIETSTGSPDMRNFSARVRIGREFGLSESASITPYVQALYTKTSTDAYAEQGGVYPGDVQAQKDSGVERSIGALFGWQASSTRSLFGQLAYVDLNNDAGASVTIVVSGLGTISTPGIAYDRNWWELSVGGKSQLKPGVMLEGGVGVTTGSNYPEDWNARLGVSFAL